jgi:hypothetical protein
MAELSTGQRLPCGDTVSEAYSTARFCKIMAVVTAVETLVLLWLKKGEDSAE